MPNTVPAADTGLPTINRRSALAKLDLGLAASTTLAATAIAAPDAGVSPELMRLIEAHRAAFAADKEAGRWFEEAEQAYAAIAPALPFKDIYGRPRDYQGNEHFPLEISLGMDLCRERFLSNLEFQQTMSRHLFHVATPKRAKQLRAAMKALKKDGLALIDSTFAQNDAARQSSGLAAAEAEFKRASAAEGEAMAALCAYRCQTLAETRLRGGYLASDHLGADALTQEHIEALLQSSRAEA
jgi:hypothetical protein